MNLVSRRQRQIINLYKFISLGVNLTTKDSLGQLDAYVQNGEWDLQGIKTKDL